MLTTVYLGATDRRALDWLVARGAQVRVSTDTRRTRLHAKAWLFHRASGTSTAYIGSSNLSSAALETPAMLAKFQSTIEANWEEGEFEPYAATPEQQVRLDHHLARARGDDDPSGSAAPVWFNRASPPRFRPQGSGLSHRAARGSRVLLFVREQHRVDRWVGGVTKPFHSTSPNAAFVQQSHRLHHPTADGAPSGPDPHRILPAPVGAPRAGRRRHRWALPIAVLSPQSPLQEAWR